MISCVLLSAGFSQRFGSPKALAQFHGMTVIQKLQKTLVDSQTAEVVIVLGAYCDEIKSHILNHKKVRFVYNKDYILGQTSSFKIGLKEISGASSGFFLLPVDYPFVSTETVDMLIRKFEEKPSSLLIPTYEGKKGHPPLFSSVLKEGLSRLEDSIGINVFQHNYLASTDFLPVNDRGVISTFNTIGEWKTLKESFPFAENG